MSSPHSILIPCRVCNTTTNILGTSRRLPDACGRCGARYNTATASFGPSRPTLVGSGPERRRSPRLVP
jgi:hypothetical protein